MPRHKFTMEERQRGGRARARQAAQHRRDNPSPAEAKCRRILIDLGIEFYPEHEIKTELGTQYLDIWIPDYNLGIEIDGSNGWHLELKMAKYDIAKQAWAEKLNYNFELVMNPNDMKGILEKYAKETKREKA